MKLFERFISIGRSSPMITNTLVERERAFSKSHPVGYWIVKDREKRQIHKQVTRKSSRHLGRNLWLFLMLLPSRYCKLVWSQREKDRTSNRYEVCFHERARVQVYSRDNSFSTKGDLNPVSDRTRWEFFNRLFRLPVDGFASSSFNRGPGCINYFLNWLNSQLWTAFRYALFSYYIDVYQCIFKLKLRNAKL